MVTEAQPLVKLARTGMGSSAMALRIPLRPEGACGKNINRALALLLVGACAGANTTPLSTQESTHRPVISALSKVMTWFVCAIAGVADMKVAAAEKKVKHANEALVLNRDIMIKSGSEIQAAHCSG